MSTTRFDENTRTLLGTFFPDIIFQGDSNAIDELLDTSHVVKIFDTCIDSLRNPIFYPNPHINELFTSLWTKIGNKDGMYVALDQDSDKILAGIGMIHNYFIYLIKIPSITARLFSQDPIGFNAEILFAGKMIEGYQAITKNRDIDLQMIPYKLNAYRAEFYFLKYMSTKYGIDTQKTQEKVNSFFKQDFPDEEIEKLQP